MDVPKTGPEVFANIQRRLRMLERSKGVGGFLKSVLALGNTIVARDEFGRTQFVDPVLAQDAATKSYVDASGVGAPEGGTIGEVLTKTSAVDGEVEWDAVTGVAVATPNTLVQRDVNGRTQFVDPAAAQDAATKASAQAQATAAQAAAESFATSADGALGATAATANTLAKRDASARIKAADGVAADDVATVSQLGGTPAGVGVVFDWKVDVAAISGNVGSKLTIPTFITPSGGRVIHPSVLYFEEPWNGYQYWMAMTPGGPDADEDPSIVASHDGIAWEVPPGLTNPLDDQPGSPGAYNSDVNLTLGPDRTRLYLFWRTYSPASTGAEESLYLSTSTDGVSWSAKALVYQSDDTVLRLLSPAFIYEDGAWTMWATDIVPAVSTFVRLRSTSATLTTATWGAPTICTIDYMQSGKQAWHAEVRRVASQYVAILNNCTAGVSGTDGELYLMVSTDGLVWTSGTTAVIPQVSSDHDYLYKASLVPTVLGGVLGFQMWYTGGTSSDGWKFFRTWVGVQDVLPFAMDSGFLGSAGSIANGSGLTRTITFASGRFSVAPNVVATPRTSARLSAAVVGTPTTTSADIRLDNWSGGLAGDSGISWIATQN